MKNPFHLPVTVFHIFSPMIFKWFIFYINITSFLVLCLLSFGWVAFQFHHSTLATGSHLWLLIVPDLILSHAHQPECPPASSLRSWGSNCPIPLAHSRNHHETVLEGAINEWTNIVKVPKKDRLSQIWDLNCLKKQKWIENWNLRDGEMGQLSYRTCV